MVPASTVLAVVCADGPNELKQTELKTAESRNTVGGSLFFFGLLRRSEKSKNDAGLGVDSDCYNDHLPTSLHHVCTCSHPRDSFVRHRNHDNIYLCNAVRGVTAGLD